MSIIHTQPELELHEADVGLGVVLIVDDKACNRRLFADLLVEAGILVIEASDGSTALRAIDSSSIDLVLLNVDMPNMVGFDVLVTIRQTLSEADLPVIMTTTLETSKEAVRAFEVGANDFVAASINPDVALARIKIHLKLKHAQQALRKSQQRYALVAEGTNDGLWDWDLISDEVFYSSRWKSMLGIDPDQSVTSPAEWLSRVHVEDLKRTEAERRLHLSGGKPHFETELRMRHEDGGYRWMLCRGIAVRESGGKAIRLAGSLTDITEGKVADALTGLPNRVLLNERLKRCLDLHSRNRNFKFAVLYLDLDNFKLVNDSLGHDYGDRLLVSIARRLEGSVRISEALVSRLGGDEFAILLENIKSESEAIAVAERIIDSVSAPITLGQGREIFATVSVGISFSEGHCDAEEMLQCADAAMYHAKAHGKSCFQIFSPVMKADIKSRLETEVQIRRAIERAEFQLHYQPIVNAISGQLYGFEALARWNHPEKGLVPPSDFIPIAEETGLIIPLGKWALRTACQQMMDWRSVDSGFDNLVVSVNVAYRQLQHKDFFEDILSVLAQTKLDAGSLKVEITESSMMQNEASNEMLLRRLREIGVQVAIDDFGTGYSSLALLHQLPLDSVKIDRSFVDKMTLSSENRAIVGTIITLANRLNFDVIAEGVETPEQLSLLQSLGCDFAQGFLFSRPMPADEALSMTVAEYFFEVVSNCDFRTQVGLNEFSISEADGDLLPTYW